jgi:large subunit ribosomal protein L13
VSTTSFKTIHANDKTVTREWHLVDAEDKTLGRLASKIASLLIGKHKPYITKHADCGDYVVVINADKVRLTGNKLDQMESIHYTGYPGGLRKETARKVLARRPEKLIEEAVRGMLPKTKLGDKMYTKLFVYAGEKHDHIAQKPKPIKL